MLKWTASAQKLTQESYFSSATMHTPLRPTPAAKLRRERRATIANKENIPLYYHTSTPMVLPARGGRLRNSPLVLAPLADILNVTPESPAAAPRTPERRRRSTAVLAPTTLPNRRHSTVGFINIPVAQMPQYASTLPRFEEEYSPSSTMTVTNILPPPTGQQLALRGLLPDAFLGNPRYFTTPEMTKEEQQSEECAAQVQLASKRRRSLPKKRKLEQEFAKIAQECCEEGSEMTPHTQKNTTTSAKMGDQTLDKLIDAILDSARKDVKKKKTRKSFNLRRRTLLRNQAETVNEQMLSPSYAAGDDPASDLSFLLCEPPTSMAKPKPASNNLPPTPKPATPLPGRTLLPDTILRKLPTPAPLNMHSYSLRHTPTVNDTTFQLETPVRPLATTAKKRRQHHNAEADVAAKKFKVNDSNYFEIGLALPSIYV